MEQRFGELPQTAWQKLEALATSEALADVAEQVLTAATLDDLDWPG